MHIAIVDDLEKDRNKLATMLTDVFEESGVSIEKLVCFSNGEELLANYYSGKFELIFLDIFLGNLTGVEIARNIRKTDQKVKLVFCTVSNEFASESYKLNMDYYLSKPCSREDIRAMCKRIRVSELEAARYVILPDGQKLLIHNIVYSEYYNHLITIYTKVGENIQIRMSQGELASLLCDYSYIFPCCKGILVNFNEVEKIEGDMIVMSNQIKVQISRRRVKEVNEAYAEYLFAQLQKQMI